jgi:hypothetical protein
VAVMLSRYFTDTCPIVSDALSFSLGSAVDAGHGFDRLR